MKSTEKLVYTNSDGESITLSYFSNYVVTEFDDSDLENNITTTKNNLQDGETKISSCLESRNITIEGYYILSSENNVLERRLKKIFNPKLTGVLYFRDAEIERFATVTLECVPEIKRKVQKGLFTISLIAHDPFWKEKEKTEYIALLIPMLRYPLVIPQNIGFVFGLKKSITETLIENVGDIESGFRVIFKAKGPVINPSIINKITGAQIKVNLEMIKGDVIEVVNDPFKKQIYINGIKSFGNLDRLNSVFFLLDSGKNLIGYHADLNTMNLDVIMYYSPKYL